MTKPTIQRPARKPRRQPTGGGYLRGEETRRLIVKTAIDVFARLGYNEATTREIAERAGVNTPALQYYFGSKEGLYVACVERVVASIRRRLDPILASGNDLLNSRADIKSLIEWFIALQDGLIDAFFTEDEGESIYKLLKADNVPNLASDPWYIMRDNVNLRIFQVWSKVVAHIIGKPSDGVETGISSFAISGLSMVFHLDEQRIRDALGWSDPTHDQVEHLKAILRNQLQILLEGLARQAGTLRPDARRDAAGEVRTRAHSAYLSLRDEIIWGRLAPASRLNISTLSEQLGVNSSAVREALSRLASEHLVDVRDQKGFRVAGMSRNELKELIEARIDIESLMLRRSIAIGDSAWEDQVATAQAEMSNLQSDNTRPANSHRALYRALITGYPNSTFVRMSDSLWQQSQRYRSSANALADNVVLDQHLYEIATAALARDAELAVAALARYLQSKFAFVEDFPV